MEKISALGMDLSKQVIHVQASDKRGKLVWRKKVGRKEVGEMLTKLPEGCEVFMEACGGAHFWSREVRRNKLVPRQIAPQHVKPFVKSQKNDYNDTEAILEAGSRPTMRFVSTKTIGQQELQSLHRIRSRRIAQRTALINQIRGILLEHGIAIAQNPGKLRRYLVNLPQDDTKLSSTLRQLLCELREELSSFEQRIKDIEKQILHRAKACSLIQRLMTVPGIGLLTATALAVVNGEPKNLKNGRQFAASLGLVPRQVTTGGKPKLLNITKRGDVYVRSLLIHGARSVVQHALRKHDPHSLWIKKLHAAKGMNLTAVAVANKNARIAWRIMTSNAEYDPALPHADIFVQ